MIWSKPNSVSTLALLVLLSTGCGGGDQWKRPPMAKVSGTILYKGKPAPDVGVVFTLKGAPVISSGVTDADGKFQLTTYNTGDGGFVGENDITVTQLPPKSTKDWSKATRTDLGIEQTKILRREKSELFSNNKQTGIPAKYAMSKTSNLKKTIVEGQKNVFEIELTD